MSDDFSARLALPYLAAGQMQKHVTLNEALTRLDALTSTAVVSATTAAQPSVAADGALYILPAGATGAAWAGRTAGVLMRFEAGGWAQVAAPVGLVAVVLDTQSVVVRAPGEWRPLGGLLGEVQNLSRLGVGATADAGNPVAVKAGKMLFTTLEVEAGGDGDLRMTLNKQGAADVLSLLFQSGWGGRAELGLVGDDDFSLKVSADGGTWTRAFAVDRATGRVDFDQGATRRETTVFTANGSYVPPVWARWVEAVCVGGGAGGGSGMAGAAGTARFGGGGGGAGGLSEGRWPASALSAGLAVTVGAGGNGGAAASGAGVNGGNGADSRVALSGVTLLSAAGGSAGGGGSATAGASGAGGLGARSANAGGASSITATAGAGAATTCTDGPGGGGAGGGLSAADVVRAGGAGGAGAYAGLRAAGGTGGASVGASGQASASPNLSWAGGGGGGGGASTSASGFAGGPGAIFGAGGGGGGAGLNTSGAGGAGGGGVVRITAVG